MGRNLQGKLSLTFGSIGIGKSTARSCFSAEHGRKMYAGLPLMNLYGILFYKLLVV